MAILGYHNEPRHTNQTAQTAMKVDIMGARMIKKSSTKLSY